MAAGSGFRRVPVVCVVFACLLGGATASGQVAATITFVHATDFHLLVDNLVDAKNLPKVTKEREVNAQAAKDLFTWIAARRATDSGLRGLIITGDFDADPCWLRARPAGEEAQQKKLPVPDCLTKVDQTWRADQIARVADAFAAASVPHIYIVPGNNDIANEASSAEALKFFNDFIAEVQAKVAQANPSVTVVNFGLCFAGTEDARCYADVRDTSYRLIPLPSYSFKNRGEGFKANASEQQAQIARFSALVAAGAAAGRRILVITHTPEIDDPYALAQQRFQGVAATKSSDATDLSKFSTWDVSKAVLDEWKKVLDQPSVAGVLAGHLHDSHKEIYRAPYSWAATSGYRDFRRLFLTPPLAVKNQSNSPIQARGFSLIHLRPDEVRRELYWYDGQSQAFTAEQVTIAPVVPPAQSWLAKIRRWVRSLLVFMAPQTLQQVAVFFIALLAAFLTVVRVWQIPPASNPLATTVKATTTAAGDSSVTAVFDPSPFAGQFGKTVVIGLGGLVAETLMQAFSGKAPAEADRHFYIAWFVLLFLVLLMTSAFFRGLVEAMRARLTILYRPARRMPVVRSQSKGTGTQQDEPDWWAVFRQWTGYWARRFLGWLRSWQTPLMTFLDTAISLVQGKNQTETRAFMNVVKEQHRNVLRITESMRARLNDTIEQALRENPDRDGPPVKPGDVRVNISVMSPDQSSVHYIARAPHAGWKEFARRSVAYVAVFTGKIRWYVKQFQEKEEEWKQIVLYDNSGGAVVDSEPLMRMDSHYQDRNQDYEAFVVFPVPWPQRAFEGPYVKGGVQISFKRQADFRLIWLLPELELRGQDRMYVDEELLLEKAGDIGCNSEAVRLVLLDTILVVGEALRGFNENLYRSSGGADQLLNSEEV